MAEAESEAGSGHQEIRPIALTQLGLLLLLLLPAVTASTILPLSIVMDLAEFICLTVAALCVAGWPFLDQLASSLFDRCLSFAAGAFSLACAFRWNLASFVYGYPDRSGQWNAVQRWFVPVAVVLAVLVVVLFGRQMLRYDRTHVIRGLASGAVGGLAGVCAGGWVFLPAASYQMCQGLTSSRGLWFLAIVVVLLALGVALCMASWTWVRDTAADKPSQSWLAIALLPIMLCGALVVVALFLAQLVLA